MRIAVVTLPVSGHLNPMTSLARRIKSNGHHVVMISVPDVEKRALACGLEFLSIGAETFPAGSTAEFERLFSTQEGYRGLKFTFDPVSHITAALLRPLTSILQHGHFNGVVFDTYQPYLELAAMYLKVPYVHVANAAPFDVSGETPLCFFDWPNELSPAARKRNAAGVGRFRELLRPSLSVAKAFADEYGIEVDWDDLTATRSKRAWITQMPRSFDFHSRSSHSELRHTGPFLDSTGSPDIDFPWGRLTGAPLVYAPMGTLQNGVLDVFRSISEAAEARKHLQFVIATGRNVDLTPLLPAPENVIFVQDAPQPDLLMKASLCITHGGLNTVLESLAQGVPLAAIPVTNDEPGIAARIRHRKAGDFVPFSELTAVRLGRLIDNIFHNPAFHENALRLKKEIARVDGLALAAGIIEGALRDIPASEILRSAATTLRTGS